MKISIEEFPDEKKATIERYVARMEHLVPCWVKELYILNRPYYHETDPLLKPGLPERRDSHLYLVLGRRA
jgi:hypothetical protein